MGQEPGGSWFIRFRENGVRKYKGGLPTRALAEALLAKVRGDIVRDGVGLPPDPKGFPLLSAEAESWLKRRELTHRAWRDDRVRWNKHLLPAFGKLRAADVDAGRIRAFVEEKLRDGLDPATVGHCVRLLSTFYSDLCERPRETGAKANPVRSLPRSTRRLYRPKHDPKRTPFVEKIADVRSLLDALPEERGVRVAYALGALAGLRTGEVLAIAWESIDLDARRISIHEQVRMSKLGPVKDDEARTVPVLDDLLPLLAAYKLKTGGKGRLFQPSQPGRKAGRNGARSQFMRITTLHEALDKALAECGLPAELTWYQSTRHTFASHWVMSGGSLEKLAHILGHSSTEVTKRYAHLRPDAFTDEDRARVRLPKPEKNGQRTGSRKKKMKTVKSQEMTS